jgi:PhnB protein
VTDAIRVRIPVGFGTVNPYLLTDDAPRLLRFLVEGLGGIEILRHMDGPRVANAQVRLGTSAVMVSQASPAVPAMPASLYLFVADADASMKKAIEAGADMVMSVADMPYQDRQGGVRDPCGNIWWISQRLVDGPY